MPSADGAARLPSSARAGRAQDRRRVRLTGRMLQVVFSWRHSLRLCIVRNLASTFASRIGCLVGNIFADSEISGAFVHIAHFQREIPEAMRRNRPSCDSRIDLPHQEIWAATNTTAPDTERRYEMAGENDGGTQAAAQQQTSGQADTQQQLQTGKPSKRTRA